jgi:hypothetical protein
LRTRAWPRPRRRETRGGFKTELLLFTRYKVLLRIQEPFLFVKRHAVIHVHFAARRFELAYLRRRHPCARM